MTSYLVNEDSYHKLKNYNSNLNSYSYSIHSKVSAILACLDTLKSKGDIADKKECINKIEELSKSIITDFHKSLDYYNQITPFS